MLFCMENVVLLLFPNGFDMEVHQGAEILLLSKKNNLKLLLASSRKSEQSFGGDRRFYQSLFKTFFFLKGRPFPYIFTSSFLKLLRPKCLTSSFCLPRRCSATCSDDQSLPHTCCKPHSVSLLGPLKSECTMLKSLMFYL